MEFFRWQREAWHKQLIASGARFYLGNDRPLDQLDIGVLRQATDAYIRKRGLTPWSSECDERLSELVSEHARREQGGSKRVGFLACIHALSQEAASRMLVSMREEGVTLSAHGRYLNCLVLSHSASPLHIQERESRVAQALMQLLTTPNYLAAIMLLFENLDQDPDRYLLPPEYIKSVFQFIDLYTTFQGHLTQVYQQRKLMSLHNSVSWLGPLLNRPPDSTAIQVVSELLPHWRDWTTWKPNYLRLMRWEGGNFTESQKTRLRPIFDLEGPDITGAGHASLKKSVPSCFEYVRVANDDPSLLTRLLRMLDNAQKVPGTNSIDLVIFLCIDNPSPIDPELLSLIDTIIDTKDDASIHAMLVWLQSHSTGFNSRMAALTQVLPVFDGRPALQHLLAAYISSDVLQVLPAARAEYESLLNEGVAQHLGMRIYRFSAVVHGSSWLHPLLPPELLRSIQRLPSEEALDEILDALEASDSFVPQIHNYLRVVIGGQAGDADAMLPAIQKSIRFYRRGVRPDQASLAHAINNVHYLDAGVREACLEQLLAEKDSLLRDLLPIVRTESNMSCVDFASLLVRRNHLGAITHQCWYLLLFQFLLHRRSEILSWSASELLTHHFFQWVHDLRILFPDGDGRSSLADLGFTAPRYQWWHALQNQYGTALTKLEELFKGQGNLNWLWLEEVPEVTGLLDLLQRQHAASPQQNFIVSYLQPSTYAISLTSACLSGLNRAAPPGRVALESVCAREQQTVRGKWLRQATQVLSYCWRLSPEISPVDREALRMLTFLVGLNDGVDVQGIYNARQCLLADYRKLVASAQELEEITTQLRNDNAAKTTAFLENLGVEDIQPPPPLVVDFDIPVKLSSFVESIGDRHWELCFPLSNLSTLKRQTVGIAPSSTLLLVRIQLPRQLPPKFCIHFHPDRNDDDDSKSHTPHPVAGILPEGPSCATQSSTLLTYILSRVLYTSISQNQHQPPAQALSAAYWAVTTTLSSPSSICPVCTHAHASGQAKVHRPTVCSTPQCLETFSRAPMEVRAHHVLSDPLVLEFLFACLYSSPDFVPTREKILRRDFLPSVSGLLAANELRDALLRIRGDLSDGVKKKDAVLSWMAEQFGGCLVSAPAGSRIPAMQGIGQFILRNGGAADFSLRDGGDSEENYTAWVVKFYVVPVAMLWKIMSGDGLMRENVNGGDEIPEQGGGGFEWKSFKNKRAVLACEVTGGGNVVRVRYVFICDEGWTPPKMRVIGDALRQSIGALRKGRLVKE
ncbi:hypothetical protein QBC43DRAFT_55611 [Cladorrhinum sp. PSN259]|nr:hypothetical protein QBC43DRAFT_55611 [Cladorrhinum sp. PSN259]